MAGKIALFIILALVILFMMGSFASMYCFDHC